MSNSPSSPGASDSIQFQCGSCQHQLKVPSQAAGKRAQCPSCQAVQEVPLSTVAPAPPANQPAAPPLHAQQHPAQQHPSARQHPSSPQQPPYQQPSTSASPVHGSPLNTMPAQVAAPAAAAAGYVAGQSASQAGGTQTGDALQSNTPVANPAQASPLTAANSTPMTPAAPVATGSPAAPAQPQRPVGHHIDRTHEGEQTETRKLHDRIREEVGKIYVGQDELILGTLVALFSSGHVLIESVPGLGKTLFVRTLGKALGCDFGRIQFTADLMPSDVTGAPIFSMKTQEFEFRQGPVFTQLLLADEINRSPAKTHAALLEIMQEYRVTVDGKTHELEKPFLVMATQNPIESEGTYNLPEAQLDRFMFKLYVDYPDEGEEARILDLHSRQVDLQDQLDNEIATVTSPEEINRITRESADIKIAPQLLDYINKLVRMTRQWPQFHMGASPRAGIAMMQGARTLAAFSGRDFAIPDDVVEIALPTLRHRVILTAEAEVEGQEVDQILQEMIRAVEVPRI